MTSLTNQRLAANKTLQIGSSEYSPFIRDLVMIQKVEHFAHKGFSIYTSPLLISPVSKQRSQDLIYTFAPYKAKCNLLYG